MSFGLEKLWSHSELYIRQVKEWTEIIVDWETGNKYTVLDAQKNALGYIAEEKGGFWTFFRRGMIRSHRSFVINVLDSAGQKLLVLSRSFFFFFSDLAVTSVEGLVLGSIHRRFGLIRKKYDLRDENGHTFARIASPIWRLWTFPVYDEDGAAQASINKRWGGGLREIFTDADTFQIAFGSHHWTQSQRAVIFAAAISIDFDFFENNQGRGGLLDLVTPS